MKSNALLVVILPRQIHSNSCLPCKDVHACVLGPGAKGLKALRFGHSGQKINEERQWPD